MRDNARLIVFIALVIAFDAALLILPPGRAILDARLHWSVDDAAALFAVLGAPGRAAYVRHQLLDLAFIASYAMLGHTLASRLRSRALWVTVLGGAFCDVVETAGILLLLRSFPSESRALVSALGWFTSVKWLALSLAVAIGLHACLGPGPPRQQRVAGSNRSGARGVISVGSCGGLMLPDTKDLPVSRKGRRLGRTTRILSGAQMMRSDKIVTTFAGTTLRLGRRALTSSAVFRR